jgi:uncharacterized protein
VHTINKGLLPKDYETSIPGGAWKYADVDDLPKAAKDWPQINFVIYHSALRALLEPRDSELAEFEKNGDGGGRRSNAAYGYVTRPA